MVDAREYHERTNHTRERIRSSSHTLDERTRPRPFKAYRDRPSVPLYGIAPPNVPALSAIATASPNPNSPETAPQEPIDRKTIATLAYLAAGITQETEYKGERTRFRAASCTGNLHHIDAYLINGGGEIDAGVYHFDPPSFSLDELRRGDFRGTMADAAGGYQRDAPLWIVLTSTWWRNAWKYRERTYRHAFWDSGTVIANLLGTAHGLDLTATVVTGFTDKTVTDLIGVDPTEEAPIAAVAIGSGEEPPATPSVDPIDFAEAQLSPDKTEYPLIHEAWSQSVLSDDTAVTDWRERCHQQGAIGRVEPGEGTRIDLDPVDDVTASGRPLLETVKRRGSKRQFTVSGPSRRKLGTVLDRATRGVPADWSAGGGDGLRYLDAYVLTTGIEGVPDGTYQFHESDAELERIGDMSQEVKTRLALNQDWAGEAHANVYLMADIEAIVDALGDRGYRLAQLEAGITLGRFYLAASAHRNLGGTGLTFFDEDVKEQLSPRSADQWPMTLFAFGTVDPDASSRF